MHAIDFGLQIPEHLPNCYLAVLSWCLFSSWSVLSSHQGRASERLVVREPLERLGATHMALDGWEVVLYVMGLSFVFEGMSPVHNDFFVIWFYLVFSFRRSQSTFSADHVVAKCIPKIFRSFTRYSDLCLGVLLPSGTLSLS